jgi:hypothetical protein
MSDSEAQGICRESSKICEKPRLSLAERDGYDTGLVPLDHYVEFILRMGPVNVNLMKRRPYTLATVLAGNKENDGNEEISGE